ncbi:MAG: cytochrome c-type biogenesis protein CcmH [Myxococcales bacterium]|nr:cytochrome c-type biogenesis protein CcmH [Myxococcales bacterium]
MSRRLLSLLVLWATLAWVSGAFADQPSSAMPAPSVIDDSEYVPGAKRLEQRLLAPCCWDTSKQTLDVHDSPVATDLKREIKRRLKAGEQPDAIEADLVDRYGEKIRAVPEGNPLKGFALILSILGGGAFLGLAYMLYGWQQRAKAEQKPPPKETERDEWDDALDQELKDS